MLQKFPAPSQRFTREWKFNERTSKSGSAIGYGETSHASASPPASYTLRLNAAIALCSGVLGFDGLVRKPQARYSLLMKAHKSNFRIQRSRVTTEAKVLKPTV